MIEWLLFVTTKADFQIVKHINMFAPVKHKPGSSPTLEKPAPFFQAKLTIGQPGDRYEQEADAVADRVVGMGDSLSPVQNTAMPIVQTMCTDCEQEEKSAQRKATTNGGKVSLVSPPPIVEHVLTSTGEIMDSNARQIMEHRFGDDFSQVRIHTDEKAAVSAASIQAKAYTSGHHIVFGKDQYQPNSSQGRHLLAHELTHVQQQQMGHGTIQRSLTSGLIGGGIGLGVGAVGGALIGNLLGGVGGAVIGGIAGGLVGLVGGALIGDAADRRSRSLKTEEKEYARRIFCDSIDYSVVQINRGSMFSVGNTPRTTANMINFTDGEFVGNSMDLNPSGLSILIHELGHVWQYQYGGLAYIPSSLIPQMIAGLRGESRNEAYNWRQAIEQNLSWPEWNAEQQAECISDYNDAVEFLQAHADDPMPSEEVLQKYQTVVLADPYIRLVRRGIGAPGSSPDVGSRTDPTGSTNCPDLLHEVIPSLPASTPTTEIA